MIASFYCGNYSAEPLFLIVAFGQKPCMSKTVFRWIQGSLVTNSFLENPQTDFDLSSLFHKTFYCVSYNAPQCDALCTCRSDYIRYSCAKYKMGQWHSEMKYEVTRFEPNSNVTILNLCFITQTARCKELTDLLLRELLCSKL